MFLLEKLEDFFLASCMLATSVLLFTNVACRYFFQLPLFWAEEVLRYLIVWVTFVGMAVCIRKNAHISLDLLLNALPQRPKAWLAGFIRLLCLVGALFLFWYSLQFTLRIYHSGQVSATIGGFPMYVIYSVLPLGFALSALHSLRGILAALRGETIEAAHIEQGGE